MSQNRSERIYSKEHVWLLSKEQEIFILGISEYAQEQLGDIVFVELPSIGDAVTSGESCAVVESVKSASDVICSVTGEVVAINEALIGEPELINESPLDRGWILELTCSANITIQDKMSAQEYAEYLANS